MNKVYELYVSPQGEIQIPPEVLKDLNNPQELELSAEGNYFLLVPAKESIQGTSKKTNKDITSVDGQAKPGMPKE